MTEIDSLIRLGDLQSNLKQQMTRWLGWMIHLQNYDPCTSLLELEIAQSILYYDLELF
jgi:hypothetical protein